MRQFNFTIGGPRAPLPWNIRAAMQLHDQVDQVIPQHGDRLTFFYGHNGAATKLGCGTCKSSKLSMVWRSESGKLRISEDGVPLLDREVEWLARDAGYASAAAFLGHFETAYKLPFYGVLLRW